MLLEHYYGHHVSRQESTGYARVLAPWRKPCRFTCNPVRLPDSHVPVALPPRLGEHTREVLAEAGLDDDAIAQLIEIRSPDTSSRDS